MRRRPTTEARLGLVAHAAMLCLAARTAMGAESAGHQPVDAARMLYWAPEFGGPERPHVLTHKECAFWAEVEAVGQDGTGAIAARHESAAMERLMLEDLWSARQAREQADPAEFAALAEGLMGELKRRVGGEVEFDALLAKHEISLAEVFLRIRERARALRHAESHFTRVRSVSESDLRTSWDAQKHPFLGRDYGEARAAFAVWYRVEVLRGLELEQLRASRRSVRVRDLK